MSGVVTQPLKGARRGGFFGFVKGIGKGLVGLVFKPISGVFDFASHTTEGLKNTVTYFDDKANEMKMRKPRAFYGREKYFKRYVLFEADLLNNLKIFEDGKYAYDNFISSFIMTEGKNSQNILIITFEHIIYFNQEKKQIIFVVEPENITSIEKEDLSLKILVNQNSKVNDMKVACKNDKFAEEITNMINQIRYITLCINLQI